MNDLLKPCVTIGDDEVFYEEKEETYVDDIDNVSKTVDTLKRELSKREMNDNILEALQGFKNGVVVFEATPKLGVIKVLVFKK